MPRYPRRDQGKFLLTLFFAILSVEAIRFASLTERLQSIGHNKSATMLAPVVLVALVYIAYSISIHLIASPPITLRVGKYLLLFFATTLVAPMVKLTLSGISVLEGMGLNSITNSGMLVLYFFSFFFIYLLPYYFGYRLARKFHEGDSKTAEKS